MLWVDAPTSPATTFGVAGSYRAIVTDLLLGGFMGKLGHLLGHKHWREICLKLLPYVWSNTVTMTETILVSSPAQGGMIEFDPSLPLQEELLDQSFDLTQVVDKRPRSTSVLTLGLAATPTNARPLRRTRGASVLRFSESEPWHRCKKSPFLRYELYGFGWKDDLSHLWSIWKIDQLSSGHVLAQAFL